ncbi:MAG TPA: CNNM domain-containing protein [Povalibacter sp.]|nr:CNNM domain-containing protein [Povalibacter sp.]
MDPDSLHWPATAPTAPLIAICVLIALAALLSACEAAFLSVNRYRLRSLARLGNASARRTELLLAQSDRLTTTILLCRIGVSVVAAIVTGVVAAPYGSAALTMSAALLALLLLVLGYIAPGSLGSRYPERFALSASWPCAVLVRLLKPLVWTVTALSDLVLRAFGKPALAATSLSLSTRDIDPGAPSHQRMVARILELQSVTVEDIMVPRSEISSIDVNDDWDSILDLLRTTPHTRLPLCEGNLDNVVGMLHMKKIAHALAHGELSRDTLLSLAHEREAYFVPAGTTLDVQLQNFQRDRRRIALVVDEYGDIRGLVTLEDILEEIVGEFTSDPGTLHKDIHREADGSYVINGAINVRVLNRTLGWNLPLDGPRTLNGLILEYLENIPEPGTSLKLGNLSIEILQAVDNAVKTARIRPLPEDVALAQK